MTAEIVLDRNHLARYTLSEPELEREVLGLFVERLPVSLAALYESADATARHRAAQVGQCPTVLQFRSRY